MDAKLDWVSFTYNWDNSDCESDLVAMGKVATALLDLLGEDGYGLLVGEGDITHEKGRKPYSCSVTNNQGWRVFFNHKINHALVEISGEGCQRIFTQAGGEYLLQLVKDRVTRVDIACDIECDVKPSDFVSHREPGRFKSFSHIVSDTGETCYIGSMSSNRYARVYRYNAPHPRAGLLRAEHVFRAEDAKKVIEYGFAHGLDDLVQQVTRVFGWSHPVWTYEPATERELTAHRVERTDAGTLKWLLEAVVPAVERMWNGERRADVAVFMRELAKVVSNPDDKPVDRLPY